MDFKKTAMSAAGIASTTFIPGGFLLGPIAMALANSQNEIKEAEGKDLAALEKEAKKQRIVMEFQAHQARVAQEASIAERISSSETVEIEEYYDATGKGNVGLSVADDSLGIGASGEGRKITKRVIKFNGVTASTESAESNGET